MIKRYLVSHLHAVASKRPPGYIEDVLSKAIRVSDTYYEMEESEFYKLRIKYGDDATKITTYVEKGLGEEVHYLLSALGINRIAELWEEVSGIKCNCPARREEWNRKFPGGWRDLWSKIAGGQS